MPKSVSTILKERRKVEKDAIAKIGLAQIYYEDGALATAAERLRAAADLLDKANGLTQEALEVSRGAT